MGMELFVKTTVEKENDIRHALVRALQNLVGYRLEKSETRIAFPDSERASIQILIIIPGLSGALPLLDALYNNRNDFFQAISTEVSEELFRHLVFTNRITDVSYYRDLYPTVNLTISDYVIGGKFLYTFQLK